MGPGIDQVHWFNLTKPLAGSDKTRLSDGHFFRASHELDQLSERPILFAVIHGSIYGRPNKKPQLGGRNSSGDNTANSMLTIPLNV